MPEKIVDEIWASRNPLGEEERLAVQIYAERGVRPVTIISKAPEVSDKPVRAIERSLPEEVCLRTNRFCHEVDFYREKSDGSFSRNFYKEVPDQRNADGTQLVVERQESVRREGVAARISPQPLETFYAQQVAKQTAAFAELRGQEKQSQSESELPSKFVFDCPDIDGKGRPFRCDIEMYQAPGSPSIIRAIERADNHLGPKVDTLTHELLPCLILQLKERENGVTYIEYDPVKQTARVFELQHAVHYPVREQPQGVAYPDPRPLPLKEMESLIASYLQPQSQEPQIKKVQTPKL